MQLARSLFLSRERTWRRKVEEALPRGRAGEELQQAADPHPLPEPGEPRPRQLRRRGGLALLLRQARRQADPHRGGNPGRHHPGAEPLQPVPPARRWSSASATACCAGCSTRATSPARSTRRPWPSPSWSPPSSRRRSSPPTSPRTSASTWRAKYGATTLYEGGLQVRTTLDRQIQQATEKAVRGGLLRLDHRRGLRGPIAHLETATWKSRTLPTWGSGRPVPGRWYQGLVLELGHHAPRSRSANEVYTLDGKGIAWTRRSTPGALLKRGRRGLVPAGRGERKDKDMKDCKDCKDEDKKDGKAAAPAVPAALKLMLEQEPRMEAAAVVIEHRDRRGARAWSAAGTSSATSSTASPRPSARSGSAFKPFVYGAALEAGWTPSDTLLDAPTYFRGGDGRMSYRPENYYKKHYGIVTLRRALEQSINVPAVKLWDLVGGQRVIDFAAALRHPDQAAQLPQHLARRGRPHPHGARRGLRHDRQPGDLHRALPHRAGQRARTATCWSSTSPPPTAPPPPATAYVLTHMMEGVIDHGTAFELQQPADRHRGQDRHHRRLLRRLVRRLHAALHDPDLGRLRPEALARLRHERRGRRRCRSGGRSPRRA